MLTKRKKNRRQGCPNKRNKKVKEKSKVIKKEKLEEMKRERAI